MARKLPTYRLSWLFVVMAVVAVGAYFTNRHLRIEAAVVKLNRIIVDPRYYDPDMVVDAANSLRRLSHEDAIEAMDRYYEISAEDIFSTFDLIIPLVFEANEKCPKDKVCMFAFGEHKFGRFKLVGDRPELVEWQCRLSGCLLPGPTTSPVDYADRWGRLRSGYLRPGPRAELRDITDSQVPAAGAESR